MSIAKRIATVIAALLALLLALALGGVGWFLYANMQHLVPPPDPVGQPSIASFVVPAPTPPATSPELVSGFSWDSILTPPKAARAWTRWWWPGGDVDARVLTGQLDELDAAGFGGAEVQPFISGMLNIENQSTWERVYAFDKPAYYQTLGDVMSAATARGLQLDLTHFSGWPPGGPEINLGDSLTVIAYAEENVSGGRTVRLELPKPHAGPSEYIFTAMEFAGADFINFPAEHARLISVVAARALAGKHARSPFNLDDTVTLDPGSVQVLKQRVENGVLHWDAPPGEWQIIASYLLPSGEVPMGAAQKPQGFVVDHLRKPQVLGHYEYAYGQRTGLPAHYGKGFRGFFNDSLEFRVKRLGVEDILGEFEARRGYDLEPLLPAIYIEGKDSVYFSEIVGIRAAPEFALTAQDERIRHDYQMTLSDLVIERFVEASATWAAERGLLSRGQSYGMDIDILRALGANTIPEAEQLWAGGSDLGLKMASSAAALYGRPLVSAESFVWIQRDWTTTARKLKAAADKMLLAGVNHIVYHGTPYPWSGDASKPYGEEGWTPFSSPQNPAHFSSIVGPDNPALWPDVPEVNRYIARSQNLLRQGGPAIDVLIYYPFLGFHGSNPEAAVREPLLNGSIPDADPPAEVREDPLLTSGRKLVDTVFTLPPEKEDEREVWVAKLLPIVRELDRRGISWGWVNDHALQSGKIGPRTLMASGGSFHVVLLPDVPMIEQQSLRSLAGLAQAGTPVVFAGDLPSRQPGYLNAAQGDAQVKALVASLITGGAKQLGADPAVLADALQAQIASPLRHLTHGTIRSYRRHLDADQDIVLFANQDAAAATLELEVDARQPLWWLDAMSGAAWPAAAADGKLSLRLRGFESRFLIRGVPMPATLPVRVADSVALERPLRSWSLADWTFAIDGAAPKPMALKDWREDPALAHARGPGVYAHRFALDAPKPGARYLLDAGLVQGTAIVRVNGLEAGRVSVPPFLVDVSAGLTPGDNTIEIEVLAPLRNYFVGRALAGDPHYSHMKGYEHQLVAAGLIGPASLAEVSP
jgi:hypothetical protein